jgi:transcriptional regulator with XRE-family HTH domain
LSDRTPTVILRQTVAAPNDQSRSNQPTRVVGGNLGERIDAARKIAGLSQKALADLVGADPQMVNKWIKGSKAVSPGYLRKLAEVLPVTVDELLGVAEGQEPPFGAWTEFLGRPEAEGMTDEESRALRSFNWPTELEPTVYGYIALLGAMRAGSRKRSAT